jgi:tRNA 5-methylaminomethyl-2-thiouridine biosynthesis bifunctional protein
MTHQHAQLEWHDNQPYSSEYGDVYFSSDSGLDETQYVFLAHNQLKTRWENLTEDHFTIVETGFGTGLNFLCTWKLWRETATPNARLHFISTEKYPLNIDDLQKALSLWPSLKALSDALIQQYPLVSKAWHRLMFDEGRVMLTLLIGDANASLLKLKGAADAWFLDGFSPAKNPDMWQTSLFEEMAKHSHSATTFATFTSAGDIRRGLQSASFQVSKASGFGKKREMLYGQYKSTNQNKHTQTNSKTVIVIGGGLAGAASAEAMARRGYQVTLIERHDSLAQEASGNPLGVLYPRLTGGETALNTLALQGFLYTLGLLNYIKINNENYQQCGVLQLAFNERERKRITSVINEYPQLVYEVNKITASELSGISIEHDGMFIPQAGWLNPASFCEALTQHSNIMRLTNADALSIEKTSQGWQVLSKKGLIAEASNLIIANATDAQTFTQTSHCEMQSVRGQITLLPATLTSKTLKTVICTDGYLSPARQGQHCLGATFSPNDDNTDIREAEHLSNLNMLKLLAPNWNKTGYDVQALQGRAAIRATTSDYLPLAGAILDIAQLKENPPRYNALPSSLPWLEGLYINAGHGAKGLVNAPLCAEIIASLICKEPAPVDCTLLSALDPNRFALRELGLKRLAQTIQSN